MNLTVSNLVLFSKKNFFGICKFCNRYYGYNCPRHEIRCPQNPEPYSVECPYCKTTLYSDSYLKRHIKDSCPNNAVCMNQIHLLLSIKKQRTLLCELVYFTHIDEFSDVEIFRMCFDTKTYRFYYSKV